MPSASGPGPRAQASAGYASLETRGRTVLRARQRRQALHSPAAGAYSRADIRAARAGDRGQRGRSSDKGAVPELTRSADIKLKTTSLTNELCCAVLQSN